MVPSLPATPHRLQVYKRSALEQGSTARLSGQGERGSIGLLETLLLTPLPDFPWQVAATDFFQIERRTLYLLVVDYFSRYPELCKLGPATSNTMFAQRGAGYLKFSKRQRTTVRFKGICGLCKSIGVKTPTSSLRFPHSNGQVEHMVQTMKGTMKHASDPNLVIFSYRAMPLPWCGLSCPWVNRLPQTKKLLTPSWSYLSQFKEKQKEYFDKGHRVKGQSEVPDGSEVVITTDQQPVEGRVVQPAGTPRSYVVETPSGEVWRNRSQLNIVPEQSTTDSTVNNTGARSDPMRVATELNRIVTCLQTGTTIRAPDSYRLTD